jgi:hypothetical protein
VQHQRGEQDCDAHAGAFCGFKGAVRFGISQTRLRSAWVPIAGKRGFGGVGFALDSRRAHATRTHRTTN